MKILIDVWCEYFQLETNQAYEQVFVVVYHKQNECPTQNVWSVNVKHNY